MLEDGRIDVFLGFLPDLTKYIDRLSYSPQHPIQSSVDLLSCHKTAQTKAFVEKISESLQQMKEDGSMASMLGSYYLED